MLKNLFKPKWQSNNPSVRLKALKGLTGDSPELISLAKNDPDSNVRLEAVQNLHDISTLLSIANKADGVIPNASKRRIEELALNHSIDEKALAKAYPLIEDKSIHTKIICDTQKSTAVRKQALVYIEDQELLFNLASIDSSKEIQFLAAEQLSDYAQLKKLEKLTKNNKKLRQLLKEKSKFHQELEAHYSLLDKLCSELQTLGNGKKWEQDKTHFLTIQQQWKSFTSPIPEKQQTHFDELVTNFKKKLTTHSHDEAKLQPLRDNHQAIIQSLEGLNQSLKNAPTNIKRNEVDAIFLIAKQSWESLQDNLPDTERSVMENSYHAALSKIEKTLGQFNKTQKSLKQFKTLQIKAEQLRDSKRAIQQTQVADLQIHWKKLKAPIGLDISQITNGYNNAINSLKVKLQRQATQLEDNLAKINQSLDLMEEQIQADLLSKAIKSHQTASQLIRSTHNIPKQQFSSIKQRINTATPIIKSAQGWRHWGTDKAREQLIEQAQLLCNNTSIEALERAKQVKSLRDDWKHLGKMDPSRHQKLWEKFNEACSLAYKPCQTHFKNESNIRNDNLLKRQQICKQLTKLEKDTDWKNADWKDTTRKINKVRSQWKSIGTIDRTKWTTVNQQFNDAMDALEIHLANERRINWTKRENLVKQAQMLVTELENINASNNDLLLPALLDQAKALQSEWHPTVTASRSEEQKLWEQFRLAIDTLFNRQREDQNASRDVLRQNLQNKQAILKNLEDLSTLKNKDLLAAKSQLPQLEEDFNAITDLPKAGIAKELEAKFFQVKASFDEKITQTNHQQQHKQLILLGKKAQLCVKKEAGGTDTVQKNWSTFALLKDSKLEKQIQYRFENHPSDEKQQSKNAEQLLALILELEILLELETPQAYQQDRMKFQISRLSEQMLSSNSAQQSNQTAALQKIQECYLIGSITNNLREELDKRFQQIEGWLQAS